MSGAPSITSLAKLFQLSGSIWHRCFRPPRWPWSEHSEFRGALDGHSVWSVLVAQALTLAWGKREYVGLTNTAGDLRALGRISRSGLKMLIPFHHALLAIEKWARGEICSQRWVAEKEFGEAGDRSVRARVLGMGGLPAHPRPARAEALSTGRNAPTGRSSAATRQNERKPALPWHGAQRPEGPSPRYRLICRQFSWPNRTEPNHRRRLLPQELNKLSGECSRRFW